MTKLITNLTLLFLVSALAVSVMAFYFWFMENIALLGSITIVVSPLTAILVGLIGLHLFGREDFTKEDRFHTMYLLLALGLVVYSVADIAVGLISYMQESETFYFLISLTQFPGILLWAIGVLGYFRTSNVVLMKLNDRSLVGIVIVVPILAVASLVTVVMLQNPARSLIEVLTTAPVAIAIGVIMVALLLVATAYRGGRLSRPLGLATIGLLLIFLRAALWCCSGYSPVEPLGQAMSVVAYLLIGASLASAKTMEES